MKLVNYYQSWMQYPTNNRIPLYRRKLQIPNNLDTTKILSAELNEMNGNIHIETTNGERLTIPAGTKWSVECYSPTGELLETIGPGDHNDTNKRTFH